MKYIDINDVDTPINFRCENFNIHNNGYRFEHILMDNFILSDLEVSNEDIALIKIR